MGVCGEARVEKSGRTGERRERRRFYKREKEEEMVEQRREGVVLLGLFHPNCPPVFF